MKVFKVVLIIVALIVVVGVVGVSYLYRGIEEVSNLELEGIRVSSLKDGTYQGEYDYGRFANKLEVTIKNGRIEAIEIVESTKFEREDVTKAILEKVLAEQTTDIDFVSGATVSTKAYLKSIENALNKAR